MSLPGRSSQKSRGLCWGKTPKCTLGPAASDSIMRQLDVADLEENRDTGMDVEPADTLPRTEPLARD